MSKPRHPISYRPDIDGLRAISVLAVIFFHIDCVPGGFAGVDIFFVISGFLIGQIVLGEVSTGRFSLRVFYQRRIRRIVPALLVTILLSAVGALALYGPTERIAFAKSAIAALLFVSNLFFYETSGYFTPFATEVPLLHLWSLGVEEQFYLVFPLLAMVLWRIKPSILIPAIALVGILSLCSAEWTVRRNPEAAFYLPQNRAFELAIGVLLTRAGTMSHRLAEISGWVGIVLLALVFAAFKDSIPFPGLYAMLPCAGAALLIWSGSSGATTSRLLAATPLPYLGRISYPMYLAHWPLIVFGKIVTPADHQIVFGIGVLLGSAVIAAAVFHMIERPVRFGQPFVLWSFVGTGTLAAAAVAIGVVVTEKPSQQTDLTNLFLEGTCFLRPEQGPTAFASRCLPTRRPWALLLGDSHAAHFFNGLQPEVEKANFALGMLAGSACPPVLGYRIAERPFCESINNFALGVVQRQRPEVVILSAFWKPTNLEGLAATLRVLLRVPNVRIVVVGNTPVFEESVPAYLDRKSSLPIRVSDRSAADKAMAKLLDKFDPRVIYVPIHETTCPPTGCLLIDDQGASLYIDQGHLSARGSGWLAKVIAPHVSAE
ncbi:hypothetical protein A1D31_34020 [Bradyrhizobium liaoningense]|nr:hypothetical protein A1D31_34020 [Bradyrhizobium liaoningense]